MTDTFESLLREARPYLAHDDSCSQIHNGIDGDCECGLYLVVERIDALLETRRTEMDEIKPVAWMNKAANVFAQHAEGARNFGCETPLYGPEVAEQLKAAKAELAGLRAYAITLKKAAEPFCAIKADDGDAFNGYAPETIIRCEITVRDLRGLRMCSGYGDPVAGSAIDERKE